MSNLAAAPPTTLPVVSREAGATVIELIVDNARLHPERTAFVVAGTSRTRRITYEELATLAGGFAAGLERAGIPRGARVLVMAPPSPTFYALALAVMATERTLVVVDGHMRRDRVARALEHAGADVVIAVPSILRWWPVIPALRGARRFSLDGRVLGVAPAECLAVPVDSLWAAQPADNAPAIVSFTSGTTGVPKGVVRTHRVLVAQHRALAAAFPPVDGDVNLAAFPMAVLHNLCCGTTSVLPDAERRARMAADPDATLDLLTALGVTSVSAAPAFMQRVSDRALARRASLEGIANVVVGGGPVSAALCSSVAAAFPAATATAVFGATEAEPIATASFRDVIDGVGDGFLAGRPVADIKTLIDAPDRFGAGELRVRGPHVATSPETRAGWHRTGDVVRFDNRGRLWLLGRVGDAIGHRGRLVHPFVVEAAALSVRGVRAAGFVAHRHAPEGQLVIELGDVAGRAERATAVVAVRRRLAERGLETIPVGVVRHIPMDARHQSKVARGELAGLLAVRP